MKMLITIFLITILSLAVIYAIYDIYIDIKNEINKKKKEQEKDWEIFNLQ